MEIPRSLREVEASETHPKADEGKLAKSFTVGGEDTRSVDDVSCAAKEDAADEPGHLLA
jgi:hypothetical protein